MYLYALFCISLAVGFISFADNTLITETLPDKTKVSFRPINDRPLSNAEIKKIKYEISSYIKNLHNKSKEQSPKKNLTDLHLFKKYLDNILQKNDMQYKIANTPLNSHIQILSYLLNTLPDSKTFDPKNCTNYIHHLRVRAHTLLHSNSIIDWMSQVIKVVHGLCSHQNTVISSHHSSSVQNK